MSLFKVFDISGSGMTAQSLRLNITASNLANADSVSSSTEETYRAREPVFSAIYDRARGDQASVGVKVAAVVENQSPLQREYQPDHPMADEEGYIYKPNVDVVAEMANMISASRSYQSNVEVFNTSKRMLMRTLTMGQ